MVKPNQNGAIYRATNGVDGMRHILAHRAKVVFTHGRMPLLDEISLAAEHAQGMIRSDPSIRFRTVAEYLGYHDALYFSKVFKKYTGYYPSDFKKNLKQHAGEP